MLLCVSVGAIESKTMRIFTIKTITTDDLIYDAMFNLNSDNYPAFHSYINAGAPCDDDMYSDPNIDLDTMSDEDKKQYQASKEKELCDILEAIKNEFDKFFNELKVS